MNGSEWTVLGTLLGGILIKLFDVFRDKKRNTIDDRAQIRKELREDVTALRAEIKSLREEVESWRAKYYAQTQRFNELNFKFLSIQDELSDIKADRAISHGDHDRQNKAAEDMKTAITNEERTRIGEDTRIRTDFNMELKGK